MNITIRPCLLPHDGPDAPPALRRDRPEAVPVVLVPVRAGPG